MAYTQHDLDLDALADAFQPATTVGRTALLNCLKAPVADSVARDKQINRVHAARDLCKDESVRGRVVSALATLKETEADVTSVGAAAEDKRHAEYYNQIMWSRESVAARLNEMGWLTELIVLFRTILLPVISVIMPLAVLLMPILIFTFVLKRPFGFGEYWEMLTASLKKAMPSVLGRPRFAGRGGALEAGEQIVHLGVGAAVFVGSIWNQISAAQTMRGVVADMRTRAASVRRFCGALTDLGESLGLPVSVPAWPAGDLSIFGHAWNHPEAVTSLLTQAGELDMLASVALCENTCFPELGDHVAITDLYHPAVSLSERVPNSIQLGGIRTVKDASGQDVSGSVLPHVLLTGPNRGGKSTVLKSVGAAIVMAQSLGVVFARQAVLPMFGSVITALQPTDTLGKMSLFEAEIEFAKDVQSRLRSASDSGPMFLMMDEIFHGTNAHDGVEASQVFLDSLYASVAPVYSIISTHYMGLPARYGGSQAQTLCMDARKDPADADCLIYTYRLQEGVNEFSSVREILRERGLLQGPLVSPPEKQRVEPVKHESAVHGDAVSDSERGDPAGGGPVLVLESHSVDAEEGSVTGKRSVRTAGDADTTASDSD